MDHGDAVHHIVISDTCFPWITTSSHVAKRSIIMKIPGSVVKCCLDEMWVDTNFMLRISFFV